LGKSLPGPAAAATAAWATVLSSVRSSALATPGKRLDGGRAGAGARATFESRLASSAAARSGSIKPRATRTSLSERSLALEARKQSLTASRETSPLEIASFPKATSRSLKTAVSPSSRSRILAGGGARGLPGARLDQGGDPRRRAAVAEGVRDGPEARALFLAREDPRRRGDDR